MYIERAWELPTYFNSKGMDPTSSRQTPFQHGKRLLLDPENRGFLEILSLTWMGDFWGWNWGLVVATGGELLT